MKGKWKARSFVVIAVTDGAGGPEVLAIAFRGTTLSRETMASLRDWRVRDLGTMKTL